MSTVSPTIPPPSPAPWYRHRWPWLLMIGPGWVLCAGVAMGYLAFSRPDAMVVDDYYAQGKAINQDLRRDREAAARAIGIELVYEEAGAGARLRGTLRALGQPLATRLHLRLVHPTQPAKDIALTLTTDADGHFAALLPHLEATRWQVQVEGEQRDWRLAREWRRPSVAGAQRVVMGAGAIAP